MFRLTRKKLVVVIGLMAMVGSVGNFIWVRVGPITESDIHGEYIFRTPLGGADIIRIRPDGTYRQEYFRSSDLFQKREFSYRHEGDWYRKGFKTVIFNGWWSYCKFPDPKKALDAPMKFLDMGCYWARSGGKDPPALVFAEDMGYWYVKIQETNSISDRSLLK